MLKYSAITRGNAGRPPLIFLHGFLGAKEDWAEMLSVFEGEYYCIALDLPGHGETPYCEEILPVLKEAVKIYAPATFVGYSMGGRIALQLREYASAIVALSAHPGLATPNEREARWKIDEEWSEKLLCLPFEKFLDEWYGQSVFGDLKTKPEFLESVMKRRARQNPAALSQAMRQLSIAKLPAAEFSLPTLFVYGEEDLKYRELYARLPKNVAVQGIRNSGHIAHLEKPKECAEIILNWLTYANA
jgi:2-succinyl-6-hydroxy-2,4-cyclohexadiene-1-carboxylate synthase